MHFFEKKNSTIFPQKGPRENVWGPRKNVSPGPAVAIDGPVCTSYEIAHVAGSSHLTCKQSIDFEFV